MKFLLGLKYCHFRWELAFQVGLYFIRWDLVPLCELCDLLNLQHRPGCSVVSKTKYINNVMLKKSLGSPVFKYLVSL